MSANIEHNGKANIAYAGDSPWHKLGQRLQVAFDAETALKEANLDWEVEVVPLYHQTAPDNWEPSKFRKTVRRSDSMEEFGTVGMRYVPLQNREAFGFFDGLFGEGKCRFDTAGYVGDGGRIWILARLEDNEPIEVLKDDIVEKYILLTNDHTGRFAVIAMFTPIRVVCQNTLTLAIQDAVSGKAATDCVRVKHLGDVPNKLVFAGKVLKQAGVFYDEVKYVFQAFADKQIGTEATRQYIYDSVYWAGGDDSKARERVVDEVEGLIWEGRGHDIKGVRGSVWGAYNAITEYVDHVKSYRNEDVKPINRLEGSQFGAGKTIKRYAMKEGAKLAGLKDAPQLN